jgi:hypothetical protein
MLTATKMMINAMGHKKNYMRACVFIYEWHIMWAKKMKFNK